tara:strand:- start:423 stop:551 length:129 start_codon:yes stop_codon:yes gene_type:complete
MSASQKTTVKLAVAAETTSSPPSDWVPTSVFLALDYLDRIGK